jgi:hypothetical protein
MVSIYLVDNGITLSSCPSDREDALVEPTTPGSRYVWLIMKPPAWDQIIGSESMGFEQYHWAVLISDEAMSKEGFRRVVSIFNRTDTTSTHIRLGSLYQMVGDGPGLDSSTLNEVQPFRTEHLVTDFRHCSIACVGTTMLSDNEIRIYGVPMSWEC